MPFEPFFERFGDIAEKETRSIIVRNSPDLPDDKFIFLEMYCNDENCDCRRVFFRVVSGENYAVLAVIAFGWEDIEFYSRWYHEKDPQIIREIQGPILNSTSQQSVLAPALLNLVRDSLLKDPAYIEQIKRHYWMFKEKVDSKHFKATSISRKQNTQSGKNRKG